MFVLPISAVVNVNTCCCRAKLGTGLLSGKYSQPPPAESKDSEQEGISPVMFKNLIGRNSDFATKRQQDAQEFFLHLINTLEVN